MPLSLVFFFKLKMLLLLYKANTATSKFNCASLYCSKCYACDVEDNHFQGSSGSGFPVGVIICHTCSPFHIQLTDYSRKLRPSSRPQSKHNVLPHFMYQKQQSSEGDTKISQVSQLINILFHHFQNKVYYSGALICITIGYYKILHKDTTWFSRCRVTPRTVSQLVSGELTPGAESCFLYSNYAFETVLCKISTDYKRSQFWDSFHYTSGRIKRLPDLILL